MEEAKKYLIFVQHLDTKYSLYIKCTVSTKYSWYSQHVWGKNGAKYTRKSKYSGYTKYSWGLNI